MSDVATVHITPENDVLEHVEGECACAPRTNLVTQNGTCIAWIIVHNSFDGREATVGDLR